MPEKWTWSDYRLEGPLPISLDDWTITAYGREDEIRKILNDISYAIGKGHRKLLRLIEWFGTGKSTFLYNLCYHINKNLFFDDVLEKPEEGIFTHALAFYLTEPVPRRKFLEYVSENGLCLPWGIEQPKKNIEEARRAMWDNCIRKVAFLFLRKALHEISKRNLQESVIKGSALTRKYYKTIVANSELKTNEFITELDKLYVKDKKILDEVGLFIQYYARMLVPSIEERIGRTKVVSQEDFENFFPKLLYPVDSGEFLEAKHRLFDLVDTNLRRFTAFEKILKRIGVAAVIVMDEVEDWSKIIKERIDMDIHEIMTDAQSIISLILAFRTEAYQKIKKEDALSRYMTIVDRFQLITLEELNQQEIEELTKGILSTGREGKLELFPCTPEFVAKLASQTKRSGKFIIRQYIRTLMEILEKSLSWSRPQPELTPDLLDTQTAKSIINKIAQDEQTKAVPKIIAPEREA